LGTTSTPWLVAIFGFRVSISAGALPMLGIGASLWLIARAKRARSEPSWQASDYFSSGSRPADGAGGHLLEPRCRWRKRVWLAVDSRRYRDLDVDCHAEFERRCRDDARRTACGVSDL
jgi:hypothetical protein